MDAFELGRRCGIAQAALELRRIADNYGGTPTGEYLNRTLSVTADLVEDLRDNKHEKHARHIARHMTGE